MNREDGKANKHAGFACSSRKKPFWFGTLILTSPWSAWSEAIASPKCLYRQFHLEE